MNKGDIAVVVLIVATILVLDLVATRAVLRDDLSEKGQRLAQIALVWLFPLLGALLVLALYRGAATHSGRYPDSGDVDYGNGETIKAFDGILKPDDSGN